MENFENEEMIPLAKANFKSGLVVLRNNIDWLAEELASTMDTPDQLDSLIVELQKRYEKNDVLDFSGASDNSEPETANNR